VERAVEVVGRRLRVEVRPERVRDPLPVQPVPGREGEELDQAPTLRRRQARSSTVRPPTETRKPPSTHTRTASPAPPRPRRSAGIEPRPAVREYVMPPVLLKLLLQLLRAMIPVGKTASITQTDDLRVTKLDSSTAASPCTRTTPAGASPARPATGPPEAWGLQLARAAGRKRDTVAQECVPAALHHSPRRVCQAPPQPRVAPSRAWLGPTDNRNAISYLTSS
jgi:hypothetical protein